jgi:PAS domain S-box-containing protein
VTAVVSATRNAPALGLIGAGGQVEQATEAFRRLYPGDPAIGEQWSQIEPVLAGHADRTALALGETHIDVEAVSNVRGERLALLTLGTEDRPGPADSPNALLVEPLDESPAVVWLKDLDGRYLQVNRRYREQLGVESEQLRGHTDAELPRYQAIDGPRLCDGEPRAEPLELEYTVVSFDGRPAFAALRFAVRDLRGEPIAVCGVAAPAPEGALARTECARLMRIERWSRLDPASVRAELLQEWGIAPVVPDPVAEPLTPVLATADHVGALAALASEHDQALAALIADRDQALDRTAQLEQELQLQERRIESLHDASAGAARRAHELLQELAAERAARERVEHNHAEAHARVAHLESASSARAGQDAHEQLRADLEEARSRAEVAVAEAEQARAQAEAAEREAEQGRARAQEAQTEAEHTLARAEAAESQAEQARARAEAAEGQAERDHALSRHAQRGAEATITALRRELEQASTEPRHRPSVNRRSSP